MRPRGAASAPIIRHGCPSVKKDPGSTCVFSAFPGARSCPDPFLSGISSPPLACTNCQEVNHVSRFLIRLPSLDDVKRFCTTANQHDCDIDVCVGRYIVNAKSIMGLFSIDRDQPVTVEFHGSDAQCDAFRQALASLVVPEV